MECVSAFEFKGEIFRSPLRITNVSPATYSQTGSRAYTPPHSPPPAPCTGTYLWRRSGPIPAEYFSCLEVTWVLLSQVVEEDAFSTLKEYKSPCLPGPADTKENRYNLLRNLGQNFQLLLFSSNIQLEENRSLPAIDKRYMVWTQTTQAIHLPFCLEPMQ